MADQFMIFISCKLASIPGRQIGSSLKTWFQAVMDERFFALFSKGDSCKVDIIQTL